MWWDFMTGMLFSRGGRGTIYLSPAVMVTLNSYRQVASDSREAGGVLLGRHLVECEDLIVDEATVPGAHDKRSWASFFRSFAHQKTALKRWKERKQKSAYLGSWHTHPESDPRPSSIDLADWRKALSKDRYEGASLYFAIVGIDRLRMWQGTRGDEISELDFLRTHEHGED
jgi:integrative and conjugative element protein (TIGR02256 family)